jgi:hypothetical protein
MDPLAEDVTEGTQPLDDHENLSRHLENAIGSSLSISARMELFKYMKACYGVAGSNGVRNTLRYHAIATSTSRHQSDTRPVTDDSASSASNRPAETPWSAWVTCHGNQLPYLVRELYQNLLHPT